MKQDYSFDIPKPRLKHPFPKGVPELFKFREIERPTEWAEKNFVLTDGYGEPGPLSFEGREWQRRAQARKRAMHIPEGAEDWALVRWDEGQALGVGNHGDNGVGRLLAGLGLDLGAGRGDGGGQEAGQRECRCDCDRSF